LFCRLFYYDPVKKRSGLPMNVAALVDEITPDSTFINLVNVSQTEQCDLIVQTGAYREHQCLSVRRENGEEIEIDGSCFLVRLAPGSGERLEVRIKLYNNMPSLTGKSPQEF
jgi:hypothetical protein